MATVANNYFQGALEERKKLLSAAISGTAADERLVSLLSEVDAALRRLAAGTFGLCEECHDSVEQERLIADPLVRFCLDHLTAKERRALEADLEQAGALQKSLLPARDSRAAGWHVHYHYRPAGPVSGDYCDVILENGGGGGVFFLVGDVAGKGVSACLLMTQLHGMFRSLISVRMPLVDLLGAANRLLCETATAGQYATLVCGRSGVDGTVLALGACLVMVGSVVRGGAGGWWTAPIRWFGRHSYEVYLTHEFVVIWGTMLYVNLRRGPLSLWFLAILLLTAPLGWLVAKYFSEPMNRRLRGAGALRGAAKEKMISA